MLAYPAFNVRYPPNALVGRAWRVAWFHCARTNDLSSFCKVEISLRIFGLRLIPFVDTDDAQLGNNECHCKMGMSRSDRTQSG